jgi:hypothetical protein
MPERLTSLTLLATWSYAMMQGAFAVLSGLAEQEMP